MERESIVALTAALEEVDARYLVGYRPTVPVALDDFTDARKRRAWRDERGAVGLRLHSNAHPALPVHLFVEVPFDFGARHEAAVPSK